ncbi:FAD/NAD-P-binding domain-containing protein [Russula aff. rugulosa BPL654]|nr:FAD/NAD-P-binding domain-containing protein [Russula aff. rugulosa BPL654]
MRRITLFVLVVASLSHAFQFPFDFNSLRLTRPQTPLSDAVPVPPRSPRVAIIGAGAGGSSAAFWIAKAKERNGLDVEIDIYERNDYIGGRSTTVYPYNDTAYEPVELGASIFVRVNKNMWRATEEFNLSRYGFEDDYGGLTIWDGERVVFSTSDSWGSWFNSIKFLLRYGYRSRKRVGELVRSVTEKFLKLYTPDFKSWSSTEELNNALNWTHLTSQTGGEYFQTNGISQTYTNEFIEGASRMNYAQNIDSIHGLEAVCSLAADGGSTVKGGNWQIFEQFVERSGAQTFFKTEVIGIERQSDHTWTIVTEAERRDYDAVIIAAPYHTSQISLPADLSSLIPTQPYIRLHVTLLTTTAATPNPVYFGYKPGYKVPTTIMTSLNGLRHGGKAPEFNSLTYHGQAKFAKNETHDRRGTGEWVAKIFSMERISDEWLAAMFQDEVGWVHRKEWDAYPELPPTTKFPPIKLDDGLFYVNAFEPFISCMETETLASRNIVDMLMWEKFNSSICPLDEEKREGASVHSGFVYGWDC